MQKTEKTKGCSIALAIAFALFVLAVILAYQALERERMDSAVEELRLPMEPFTMSVAAMDRYIRKNFPEDCEGKELTHMSLYANFTGKELTSGELQVEYYRFIDDSREGGNIEAATFKFDVMEKQLFEITRERGAGRASSVWSEPVLESVSAFPLELYIENIDELIDISPQLQSRMLIDVMWRGVRMQAFYKPGLHGYDYCEFIEEWTPGTSFAERAFSEKKQK